MPWGIIARSLKVFLLLSTGIELVFWSKYHIGSLGGVGILFGRSVESVNLACAHYIRVMIQVNGIQS
jgi:hypothetical protein